MVGTTGIEPVTPAMSRQCSTAELRAPKKSGLASNHQGRARYHNRGCLLNCLAGFFGILLPNTVIPAKARTSVFQCASLVEDRANLYEVPAFAGMTKSPSPG